MLTINILVRMLRPQMDYFSKYGAGLLAARIKDYWRERGFFGIVCERYELQPDVWTVRSNIGPRGFPPRWRV